MEKNESENTKNSELLVIKADKLAIVGPDSLREAALLLSAIDAELKRIDEAKQKVLAPLNEARAAEIARWKPAVDAYTAARASIRSQMTEYQSSLDKARINDSKALSKNALSLEEAVDNALAVNELPDTLTFRDKPELKITNRKIVPKRYWVIDEAALFADLKAGKKVKGAEIEIIKIPVNKNKR